MCFGSSNNVPKKEKKKKKGLSKGIRRPKEFLAIGVGASYMKTLEV